MKLLYLMLVALQVSATSCMCPKILRQVCDADTGKMYDNSCLAKCAGVQRYGDCNKPEMSVPLIAGMVYQPTEMPMPLIAGMVYQPTEMPMPLIAGMVQQPKPFVVGKVVPEPPSEQPPVVVGFVPPGLPEPPTEQPPVVLDLPPVGGCVCPFIYAPVCDLATGITHSNECVATCNNGRADLVKGECESQVEPALCACPAVYAPVCDESTGSTYSNDCDARCQGVLEFSKGECRLPVAECMCPMIYAPVCDQATGVTHSNACVAACNGAVELSKGDCGWQTIDPRPDYPPIVVGMPPIEELPTKFPTLDCLCPEIWIPVCDTETGTTYDNACQARCAGLQDVSEGECKPPQPACICAEIYQPVCDESTQTSYSNTCEASCDGVDKDDLAPGKCNSYGNIHPDKSAKLCLDTNDKRAKVKKCDGSDGQLFAVRQGMIQAKTGKCIGKKLNIVACQTKMAKVRYSESQDKLKFGKKCVHYKGKGQKLALKKCSRRKTQKFMHRLSDGEAKRI